MLTLFLFLLLIIIFFLLLLIIVGFFFYLFDAFLDLPYVATKRNKVATIIELSDIKPGETAVDLGSGDGRLLIAAAQKGAKAIGYEVNPMLVALTNLKAWFFHLRGESSQHLGGGRVSPAQVKVYRSDLWKADLKSADVIFVYARQGTMQKMEDFVYLNAKKGARIIVNTDLTKPFPTKKPIKSQNDIYLYRV